MEGLVIFYMERKTTVRKALCMLYNYRILEVTPLFVVRIPLETKAVQSHLPVFCQMCSSCKTVL